MRVMMVASRPGEVAAALAQRELPRLRGFAEEEVLLATRRRRSSAVAAGPPPPGERFTFGRFETWETPGLNPPSATALALLHRLAADPGILGIMRRHQWSVGLLKEMPPEGKVRVLCAPICHARAEAGTGLFADSLPNMPCHTGGHLPGVHFGAQREQGPGDPPPPAH